MLATNLKIVAVVVGTVAFYTILANAIPQIESAVPEAVELSADLSPEELVAVGDELFHGAGGCTACHGLGTRAPNLLTDDRGAGPIGARCGDRVDGVDCKAYLHESLTDPNAHVVDGFQPIMPDASITLTESQVWGVIAYLQAQGGEVTVTAEDLEAAGGAGDADAGGGEAAGAAGGGPATASTDPVEIMRANQCFACHQLGEEGGPIGPPLDDVGGRLSVDEIRRSILRPNADTSAGYEAVVGTMPPNFGEQLTAGQLEALVRFLTEQN